MFKPEQVKRNIVDDPRYDAVGSSSLREELFNTYLKAHGGSGKQTVTTSVPEAEKPDSATMTQEEKERQRRERKERAVKEREEKVKAERSKLAADIDKSRQGLNKGEGELEFKCVAYFHTMTSQILGAANIDLLSLQDDVSRRNTRPTGMAPLKVRSNSNISIS